MASKGDEDRASAALQQLSQGARADEERARGPSGEVAAQIRLLDRWADEADACIAPDKLNQLPTISSGTAEHTVRVDATQGRAIKETLPGSYGNVPCFEEGRWQLKPATPREYLQRIRLANQVFADDIRLEGVSRPDKLSLVIGDTAKPLTLVTSQPWYEAADPQHAAPSSTAIGQFLHAHGFKQLPATDAWQRQSDGVTLMDARPDNFIQTRAGSCPSICR